MAETSIIILVGLLVCVISMFIVSKFNISLFGLKLNFLKSKNSINKQNIQTIISNSLEFSNKIHSYQSKIMNNSMVFVGGKLTHISQILRLRYNIYHIFYLTSLIKTKIRECFIHNGFTDYNPNDFNKYIELQIIEIIAICDKELGKDDEYIHSKEFSDIIKEIFNHFIDCFKHWTNEVKRETIQFTKRNK